MAGHVIAKAYDIMKLVLTIKDRSESFQVVNDLPLPTTGFDLPAPGFGAIKIFPRLNILVMLYESLLTTMTYRKQKDATVFGGLFYYTLN